MEAGPPGLIHRRLPRDRTGAVRRATKKRLSPLIKTFNVWERRRAVAVSTAGLARLHQGSRAAARGQPSRLPSFSWPYEAVCPKPRQVDERSAHPSPRTAILGPGHILALRPLHLSPWGELPLFIPLISVWFRPTGYETPYSFRLCVL